MEPIDILIRPRVECVMIQGCTKAGIDFIKSLQGIPETTYEGLKLVFGEDVVQETFDLIDKLGLTSIMT